MIRLSKVVKYYPMGKRRFCALNNVSLLVEDGEFVSIEGESGAGKSTLLHIIGLLDEFEEGDYSFNGDYVHSLSDDEASEYRNKKIGFVMQDFSLIPGKTVLFNVMLPLLFSGSKDSLKKVKNRAIEALERVGLGEQIDKKVNQLSGGQCQRVAIARAIVTKPEIILADEPTGALDSVTTKQIMELLKSINETEKITIIVVTHSELVSGYCRRKVVMSDGCIIPDSANEKKLDTLNIAL